MKRFSKLFVLILVFCCTAVISFAQVSFGVKAGLNLANVSISGSDEIEAINDYKKMLFTFQVGGVAEFGITDNLGVQAGLLLVGKGFKVDINDAGVDAKGSSSPMYLQVPVNLLYKGSGFYLGAGPYVGFGLFGTNKDLLASSGDSDSINFGSDVSDDYSALDFGLNIEAGAALSNGLRIGAGYALGLANAIPGDAADLGDDKIKHGVISVNIAYMFGGE